MCRRGARSFPTSACATICAWAAHAGRRRGRHHRRRARGFPAPQAAARPRGGALVGRRAAAPGARALPVGEPQLVLLDEPTEGIQPSIVDEIVETLQRLRAKRGLTIIVVEQNLDFIAALSHRVLMIQKGAITREVRRPNSATQAWSENSSASPRKARIQRACIRGRHKSCPSDAPLSINCASSPRPRHEHGRRGAQILRALMGETTTPMTSVDAMPDYLPPVNYPRTPGYRPRARRTSTTPGTSRPHQGRAARQARGQDRRDQGQCVRRRRADDERLLDARGLCARYRCDHRHPPAGRRRHHRRQVALRIFLPLRRQPHQRHRPGAQPAQARLFGRRLLVGQRALVAAGEVDMAIGGDQGGSIRIPASFCGVYGMKATHGLVPYTGVMPIEPRIDHTGPMTANVADNALLLEVLAGADGLDPRQYAPKVANYTQRARARRQGPADRRGQGRLSASQSEADVDAKVQGAPSASRSSAPASRRSRCRCICSRPRSGRRSPSRASPSR